MAKKKMDTIEFRFYEVPQGNRVLVLSGENWNRVYGHDETNLHFHNLMEIGICRKGEGRLILSDREVRYNSGCVTIIPENFPHTTISEGEKTNLWEYLFFDVQGIVKHLYPDNPVYQNKIIENMNKAPLVLDETKENRLLRFINLIIEENQDKAPYYQKMMEFAVESLVLEIMRHFDETIELTIETPKAVNMSQIAPAIDYISHNYDKNIKARDLSESCEMSETHFRRVFEQYLNMSPMDYVNLIRVQRACELMRKSNRSMDQVALESGFATTSTFNRNFKKFLNVSPYQWKINPGNYENKLLNYNISALKGWN